jgi:hypothetical protein
MAASVELVWIQSYRIERGVHGENAAQQKQNISPPTDKLPSSLELTMTGSKRQNQRACMIHFDWALIEVAALLLTV